MTITGDFPTGSAGQISWLEDGIYVVAPKPETVPDWFYEVLQVNFRGAGVPREYAFHIRVVSAQASEIRILFVFTETNGAGYMDPPYWIRRKGRWWIVPEDAVVFEPRSQCTIALSLQAGETVALANKPYVEPDVVESEMREIASIHDRFWVQEIGLTEDGRPILALETEPRDESILVNATMQPAEPASRPVLAIAHWLMDRSALSERALDRFQFRLIPQPNPDGSHHGMSCTNGHDEVPMFSFGRLLEGEAPPPESRVLWNYLAQNPPTGHIELHTHYQDTRFHKLNPLSADWFSEGVRGRAARTTEALLAVNEDWRVTELTKDTPIVTAGKFANVADRFDTISYCYQIYAVSEEATAHHAVTAARALISGLAGEAWAAHKVDPRTTKG